MLRFVEAEPRSQATLFPERIEDYIDEENSVRALGVFVDMLNLEELGFSGMTPRVTERPAYHPSTMLKLYIYGYLNRVQSTRRLEQETGRNLELIDTVFVLLVDLINKLICARQRIFKTCVIECQVGGGKV